MNPLISYLKTKYNLCTEEEILNALVTTNDDSIYDLLFRTNLLTSGMIRNIFISTKSRNLLFKIVSNPKCPSDVLEKIFSNISNSEYNNDNSSKRIDKELNRDDYNKIIINIIKNPNCPHSILKNLLCTYKKVEGAKFYLIDSNGEINHDVVIGQNIMIEVFKSPLLIEEDLEPFYDDWHFRDGDYLRNPKCSKQMLSSSTNYESILKILDNPNCPDSILVQLYNSRFYKPIEFNKDKSLINSRFYKSNEFSKDNILIDIMSHLNFPKKTFLNDIDEFRLPSSSIVNIINQKDFNEDEIRKLLFKSYYSESFKDAILLSKHCSNEILLEYFKRNIHSIIMDKSLLEKIALKANLPAIIQEYLLTSRYSNLRAKLASNPTCQEGILIKLSKDESNLVRKEVMLNPNCPIEILLDLMNNGYDDYFKKKSDLRRTIFNNKHLTLKHIFAFFESDLTKDKSYDNKYKSEEQEILLNLLMNSETNIEISESDIEMLRKHLGISFLRVESSLNKIQKRRINKQKFDNFTKGNWFNKFTTIKKQDDSTSIEQLQSKEKKLKEKEEALIITAVTAIKTLGNSVFELEKINNLDAAKNFYHSTFVPNEILYIQVGEHYEIRPDLIPYLRFINLNDSYIENLKMNNINWSETNIRLDPQTVYKKDLSNTIIGNDNVKAGVDFSGVNLQNSDVSKVEMPINLEFAITNENTKLAQNVQLK